MKINAKYSILIEHEDIETKRYFTTSHTSAGALFELEELVKLVDESVKQLNRTLKSIWLTFETKETTIYYSLHFPTSNKIFFIEGSEFVYSEKVLTNDLVWVYTYRDDCTDDLIGWTSVNKEYNHSPHAKTMVYTGQGVDVFVRSLIPLEKGLAGLTYFLESGFGLDPQISWEKA